MVADLKTGHDTSEERAGQAQPLQWTESVHHEKERTRKLAGPFGRTQGKPFDHSQDEQNCYNRAQMAGGGRSEVIWREWNRLRRSGRGYR